jgi:phosphoserine phosphatase RsbU/P
MDADADGARTRDALLWAICWLVLAATIAVDAAISAVALSGSYGLAAVVAGALVTVPRTLLTGIGAIAAAAVSFLWNDNLGSLEWGLRLLVAAALSAAAVAIAASRQRRERRLAQMTLIAETAQRAVLRTLPSSVGDVGFAAQYVSAAEEARIGGDLYEVVSTPHGTRAIVGDVKGKGLEAVQLAATVLGAFRRAAASTPDLTGMARELDRVVTSVAGLEDFVTAVLVEFGPDGSLAVVNIAHMPPVLIDPTEGIAARVLDTGDTVPPLGMHPQPTLTRATWGPGTRLLLYTDGTSESRDSQGRFFEVTEHAGLLSQGSLEQALDRLVSALTHHVGHQLTDDVALVLAERRSNHT